MATIKDRIIQVIEAKGINKEKFFAEIGMSSSNFRASAKNTPLNSNYVAIIFAKIPDVNLKWLITGEGEMFERAQGINVVAEQNNDTDTIPLISWDNVTAVMSGENFNGTPYLVPVLQDADFLITMRGNTMSPHYYAGDLLACKCMDITSFFQWDRTYVINSKQGVIVRKIQKGKDDDHLLLVAENSQYDVIEIEKPQLHSLALVTGFIRPE